MEVLINKALIDSNISHDEFVLMNNALKEYDKLKEEIKYKKNLNQLNHLEKIRYVKIQNL